MYVWDVQCTNLFNRIKSYLHKNHKKASNTHLKIHSEHWTHYVYLTYACNNKPRIISIMHPLKRYAHVFLSSRVPTCLHCHCKIIYFFRQQKYPGAGRNAKNGNVLYLRLYDARMHKNRSKWIRFTINKPNEL